MEGLNRDRVLFERFLILFFKDILKIGGPYARLAFLNASAVSKAEKKLRILKKNLYF
jgi:hypothetical protein